MELSPKKKRVLRIFTRIVFVLAILVLITALALWLFLPRERIKGSLMKELSKRLRQDVLVGDVSIGFYPDAELVVKGLNVADKETSERIVSAQKIRLDTDLFKLIKGEYSLDSIVVNSPVINLVRGDDGKWNIQKLISGMRVESGTAPDKRDNGASSEKMEVGPIVIHDGSISLRDEHTGRTIEIDEIEATFDSSKDMLAFSSAAVSFPAVDARLSGNVSKISKPDRTLDIDANLRVKKAGPLADFGPNDIVGGEKISDILLNVSGPASTMAFKGTFALNDAITKGVTTGGKAAGTLFPEEARLEVASLDTAFGKSKLSLNGSCTELWSNDRMTSLKGTANIMLAEALAPFGEDVVSNLEPEGSAHITFELAGSASRMDWKTDIDLTEAGLTIPKVMHKPPQTTGSLKMDGRYLKPSELVADNIDLNIANTQVLGHATLRTDGEPWLEGSANARNITLKNLDRLPNVRFDGGTGNADVKFWKMKPTNEPINYRGEARIEQGLLVVDALKDPVEISDMVIELSSGAVSMESSFVLGEMPNTLKAEITDFSKPHITGTVQTDTIDIDKLTKAFTKREHKEEDEEEAEQEDADSRFSLELMIEANSLYAAGITTGPVTATWMTEGKSHRFEPCRVDAFGGQLLGTFEIKTGKGLISWAADFSGENLKIEDISSQLRNDKKASIKGPLRARGILNGSGSSEEGGAMRTLGGDIRLSAGKGEITEYSWLKNIFLLIQLSPATFLVPGLREVTVLNALIDAAKTRGRSLDPSNIVFSSIDGTFHIENGIAHTEDLRLESGIANLLFKGDVDLAEKHLDLVVRAVPLGSVGTLIEKVPLAGEKLNKAKESAISADFIVSGPLSNPEVSLRATDKIIPAVDKLVPPVEKLMAPVEKIIAPVDKLIPQKDKQPPQTSGRNSATNPRALSVFAHKVYTFIRAL